MKRNIQTVLTFSVLMVLLYAAIELFIPSQSINKQLEIEIPRGATFRQAADILHDNKLIRDRKIFLMLGRLTGADRKIRAGFYSIWANMSPYNIFQIIRKGRIIEYEVRVLEGDSLREIAEAFGNAGIIAPEDFTRLSKDQGFLSVHGISAPSVEGYLFPDTYLIPKGVNPRDAVGVMIDRMREKFSSALAAGTGAAGLDENEVLTLASIIEKEAVVDSERELISAVYHNRLKKKMPLQADPTAIYGIKSSKEKIMASDLRKKTPYNTYVIRGLPPGPIASPGLKSIRAALRPADVPYLYFVSNNDGTHRFSTTMEEHTEAVRSYREKKKGLPSPEAS